MVNEFFNDDRCSNHNGDDYNASIDTRHCSSYVQSDWSQIAEATLPLKTSKLASASAASNAASFQASIELRYKQISSKVISINLVALLINLALALIAFYFGSVTKNSPAMTAFGADCILDLISSGIVLWRYYGDLNSLYMHAREQIACIYLGALFEISAIAIIIKAISDITSAADYITEMEQTQSYELVYLAVAAFVCLSVLSCLKFSLYKSIRDKSILLDVINTLISTVFALSIVMSQSLISINPTLWYLDPILSIVLACFMVAFGLKVLHQNLNILKPIYCNNISLFADHNNNNQTGFEPNADTKSVNLLIASPQVNLAFGKSTHQESPNGRSQTIYSTINLV